MKILEKSTMARVYRIRCIHCRSKLEMTEEEKREMDLKYDESFRCRDMTLEERREDRSYRPHNPLGKFDCPVCGKVSYSCRRDEHRFVIMDDGSEIMEY